jgi:chorismate synthase
VSSNSFGRLFKITTFGESHGKAVGVVIDGCPAGLSLTHEEIDLELKKRSPGQSPFTSPRKEEDKVEILSGLFEGKTTGAPIALLIANKDVDTSKYEPIKDILRPGHANYTYLEKYGIFDYRGGGRSSARETAARVAAGAVAKKFLRHFDIDVLAYIKSIGPVTSSPIEFQSIEKNRNESFVFCPDKEASKQMETLLTNAKEDSFGGIVEFQTSSLPIGLGDPIYEKLEARLGFAMLSLPATKGFEIGNGFKAASMKGSEHNDAFEVNEGKIGLSSNQAGGTLGGITSGEPVIARVAFKPTSSIRIPQKSSTLDGKETIFELPAGSRHDPCVAIRGVFVVEAMAALVLADFLLSRRLDRL